MQPTKGVTLKTKAAVATALYVAVILLSAVVLIFGYFRREIIVECSRQQLLLLREIRDHLDEKVQSTEAQIVTLSGTVPRERLRDRSFLKRFLDNEDDTLVVFDGGLAFISPDMEVLAERRPGGNFPLDARVSYPTAAETFKSGKICTSDPYSPPGSPYHPLVSITVPIKDSSGRVAAVLAANYDLSKNNFIGRISSLRLGDRGSALLASHKGKIIAFRESQRIGSQLTEQEQRLRETGLSRGGTTFIENGSSAGIYSYMHLKSRDWIVASFLPRDEAIRSVNRANRLFYLWLIFAAGISLLAARFAMKHFLSPLHQIIDHIEATNDKQGEEKLVRIESRDEFGVLGAAFNRMIVAMGEHQAALAKAKEFSEQLILNTAVPLFVIDAGHHVVSWNRACEELTGTSREKAVGRRVNVGVFYQDQHRPTLADLVLDEAQTEIDHYFPNHRHSPLINEGVQVEGWVPNLNGRERYLLIEAAPIRDREGGIVAVIETLQDITERKKAEQELFESRGRLYDQHEQLKNLLVLVQEAKREWEQTLDCIDDMVILCDADQRILRCNRAVALCISGTVQDFTGCNWKDLLLPDDAQLTFSDPENGELFLRSSERWFDIGIYPFADPDRQEKKGWVVTLHETTDMKKVSHELAEAYVELKNTQSRILQQEKMASIGQLAAGVAHEINNPIGFISSNLNSLGKYLNRLTSFIRQVSEILSARKENALSEEIDAARRTLKVDRILDDVKDLIAESQDGAERVRKIVQDLKSFSRVNDPEPKDSDINECLDSTINIVWNEIKYVAELRKEYCALPRISCQPQQLNQVFMNLLVNAAHAITGKGVITVKSWHEEGTVCVSVADTGCGIPAENIGRIFEPFFTTKEVGKGTGLGLSITYDIVKKHRGEITVESEPGMGTTFMIRLPDNLNRTVTEPIVAAES